MFIESWVDKGRTVIKTLEFRKMLRLENNYKKFSDFCRRVLDPAMQELKELAEKGFCDCHFEYEKKYDHGQRGGEPDELIFIIHRTKDKMNVQLPGNDTEPASTVPTITLYNTLTSHQ